MYISTGINTNGIKTNYFTGVNCKISKLISNYANILELYVNNINLKGNMSITGDTQLGSSLIYTSNTLTTGSISFNENITWLDTSSSMGAVTFTLPIAPKDNLLKIIIFKNGSNNAIVQISSGTFLDSVGTNTKATFTTVGQSLTLLSSGNKWAILSNNSSVTFS